MFGGFNPFFKVLDLIYHVGKHLLMGGNGVGTDNGAELFGESNSKIIRHHVQISVCHGLIVGLTPLKFFLSVLCTVAVCIGFFLGAVDFCSS